MAAEWAQRIDELADRYRAGEPVREELIGAGYPMVRAMLRVRGWYAPGMDPDDLVQEGMIGWMEAVDSWRPEVVPLFRAWAGLCVRRELVTVLKMATRRKHSPLNESFSLDVPTAMSRHDRQPTLLRDTLVSPTGDPDEYLLRQEEIREARILLLGLCQGMSRLERESILRVTDGQTYAEVARALGTTEKAIDNALQRARRKLLRRREAMSA